MISANLSLRPVDSPIQTTDVTTGDSDYVTRQKLFEHQHNHGLEPSTSRATSNEERAVPKPTRPRACDLLRDLPQLASVLTRFKTPSRFKSIWQIVNTLVPFCALWFVMYLSLSWSYWLTLLLAIPTAGLLVRLFIIPNTIADIIRTFVISARTIASAVLSLFTMTPYSVWRRSHSLHHASSGTSIIVATATCGF